ncbi:MAG: hypothetical protein H7838_08470 [Magnetococcus sp. DMHC-8]
MFRPRPAQWFHLLVAREELPQTLAVLATQHGIELEAREGEGQTLLSGELVEYLAQFQQLSRQYHAFWPELRPEQPRPAPAESLAALRESPQQVLATALAALERWRIEAEPIIQRLDEERVRQAELTLYEALARQLSAHPHLATMDLAAMHAGGGEWLEANLFVLPEPLAPLPPTIAPILCPVPGKTHHFLLAVGLRTEMASLAERVAAAKGRPLAIPYWSQGAARTALPEIRERLGSSTDKLHRLQQALGIIHRRHDIPHHLRAVGHLQWLFAAIERVRPGPWLVHLSGWTDQADEARLNRLLYRANLRAMIDLSAPPPAGEPPTLLVNPWWTKPFELFARLLGVPGQHEVDPSPLLALVVPLLFGYMFGDVGQGLLLTLIGLVLRKPVAVSWLLITGGLSSFAFGLLFGSFFCREDVLPALWLHPTQHPLPVLALPIALGVLLLLTGLLLDGISHHWQGRLRVWWLHKAGILPCYLGMLATLFHPAGWLLALTGLAWYLLGHRLAGASLSALPGILGHLLETLMQLAVNTLSFARVGAFALAHAGLSQAVVTLADLTQHPLATLLVLLLGNLLVVLLEGLVVSVQTTRLILFEFFVRFLKGEGRTFRPLPPPPGWLLQT